MVEGEISVLKELGWGRRELRRRQQPGDVFGEMALILDEKRTATILATERMECLVLNREDFNIILDKNVKIARAFLKILTNRLRQSDEQGTTEMVNAQKAMIFSLAKLAESRDPETGFHLQRVRKYCALLSEHLSRHPDYRAEINHMFIESIFFVAPLHDIGKVGIPDGILLKNDRLSEQEYAIMKTHTTIGAETMKSVTDQCDLPTFHMAYRIIRYHHERWDGKGYPDGKAGKDIPLESRIMALSDVFDALVSPRVYKRPFTYEETGKILLEGMGTQFDPVMTEIMLHHYDEFQDVHKQYLETERSLHSAEKT